MSIYVALQHIGYKRHPSIKNKLVIDEKVADIVRKIFDMYSNGHGTVEIVNYLNNNKYLSPTGYRKTGLVQDENKTNYNWNEVTLCNMLKNEVYIGNTIQNKKTVISYKVKKIRTVEKENQIRVNNTHKAIIDKGVFEKVNSIFEKRGTNTKLKYDYLLRGLLYCYHCKRKLQIVLKKSSKKNSTPHPYITCSDYKSRGCFPLNINYEKFESHIIYIVKKLVQLYANKEVFYSVYEKYKNKNFDIREDSKEKIQEINNSIIEINDYLDKMYIDKLKGILLEEDYMKYSKKFIFERTNLIKKKEELEQKLTPEEKLTQTEEKMSTKIKTKEEKNSIKNKVKSKEKELNELIENFLKLEQIHKMYLYRLINRIEIDKDKNVYIYFNFSKLSFMAKNLDEFIKIKEIINER